MHNLEPRGYVVGWIIAISLLVGILIFLLLAVLLWKVSGERRSPGSPDQTPSSPASAGLERMVGKGFLVELLPSAGTMKGGQGPFQAVNGV